MRAKKRAKIEGTCTVTAVDGAPPPAGWICRCFNTGGLTTFSFTGPGFDGLWVAGAEGCPQPAFLVTNPVTGENFCVQTSCS